MPNLNHIMLMGNLTRDPELKHLPSGSTVTEFGLAVNRKYKTKAGVEGEETLYIDCKAFGKVGEILNQYCNKGKPLFVEGRLQLDQWQDKEGNNRSKHRVFVEQFQFVDSKGGGEGYQPSGVAQAAEAQRVGYGSHGADDSEDVPFDCRPADGMGVVL